MHLLYELSYPRSVHCVGKGKPIEGNAIFLVDSIYIENFERVGGIYMEGCIIYSCSELMVSVPLAATQHWLLWQFAIILPSFKFFSMTLSFSARKTTLWNIPDLV